MHYTSWGKREKGEGEQRIPLLIEDGPEELGIFSEQNAAVGGQVWQLSHDEEGATATLGDGRVFRAAGDLSKQKRIKVTLDAKPFHFINESSSNWIIEDEAGKKIGQFSGAGNGVRRSILEFEDEAAAPLSDEERAGLSWFVRLILEGRLGTTSRTLIGTLLGFTIVGLIAFVVK
ncbi:hypothetical protein COCCU_09990 [Corynebacterium occultum]|uniref:Uncharacterized protein n=1 Tax=Corynebacterium occultum TaxID=2675219 RepID=A0A6B8W7M0_9CORY|nr:hypothetical protein [Corynebacterium occultum]QGU07917.1 hypothetical protein COCCU_09990 [Corynebacterium occultum]